MLEQGWQQRRLEQLKADLPGAMRLCFAFYDTPTLEAGAIRLAAALPAG